MKLKISKLKPVAYLHDIGKIILDDIRPTKEFLTEEEIDKMQQHSVFVPLLNLIYRYVAHRLRAYKKEKFLLPVL